MTERHYRLMLDVWMNGETDTLPELDDIEAAVEIEPGVRARVTAIDWTDDEVAP
jgi:hypothetical protein